MPALPISRRMRQWRADRRRRRWRANFVTPSGAEFRHDANFLIRGFAMQDDAGQELKSRAVKELYERIFYRNRDHLRSLAISLAVTGASLAIELAEKTGKPVQEVIREHGRG
jgi:hypothetical protein